MDRCPNCRARWESGDNCRRCGMDLGLLLTVEREAESLVEHALDRIVLGDTAAALVALDRASRLRADPLVEHLRGFVITLAQDCDRISLSP